MTDLHDRDDVIDRWLRRAASAPAGPGPNAACLDAEVMAAWAQGGLSDAALQAVRAHVADCARCQVLAAVMTKLEPAAAAAAPAKSSQRWLGWLVPLAAAAGAVAIWIFIPRQAADLREGAAPPAPAAQMAQAPEAPAALPPPAPAPGREAALSSQPAPKLKAEQQAPRDLKRQSNEKDQSKQVLATRAEESRARAQTAADPKKTDARTVPPAPVAAPPPPPAAANVAAAAQQLPPPPAMAQASADRVATGAGRGGGGGTRAVGFAESRLAKEIVSTDESTRWRITAGVVEKTTDGGRTWTRVATGLKAEFTAGASPSPTICWIVGTAGTVLLTTDGQKWEQLKFPEPTDLSAVRATDARTATVTTIDGREFATIDGGDTWIRR